MRKKIFTIVGARPQFVKASVLSRLIRDKYSNDLHETLVHTGQHFDKNMSEIFFDEMEIPKPDYNLGIAASSHGSMTGKMLIELEKLILQFEPDVVLVYGDTNSTLAGALAASKLNIPVAHVEAGLRSYWKQMPEEQNRIVTDHLSTLLFCPTENAVDNLNREGIFEKVFNVGDIMLDSFNFYLDKIKFDSVVVQTIKSEDKELKTDDRFHILTLHRAENTSNINTIIRIFRNLEKLKDKILFPIHPRTEKLISSSIVKVPSNLVLLKPVGYFTMLFLLKHCIHVITDSGGLQKEAFFMRKRCFTIRKQTEWIETLDGNWNTLIDTRNEFSDLIESPLKLGKYHVAFGDGNTGSKILRTIINLTNI